MFLLDDVVMAPFKGIFWIFKEIHDAAQQEQAGESDAITASLSELYMKLDTGQITEAEFDAQEKILLDRLDRLQAQEKTSPKPEEKKKRAKPRRQAAAAKKVYSHP
ncbi:gas vesicle protein GvpG [Desulfobacca acetoxidans]|nr:gas vesicle protein GvpG [Desulfobacterales bacterium]